MKRCRADECKDTATHGLFCWRHRESRYRRWRLDMLWGRLREPWVKHDRFEEYRLPFWPRLARWILLALPSGRARSRCGYPKCDGVAYRDGWCRPGHLVA